MLAVVDAIRVLLPLPTGATVDDSCAPPLKHAALTLYAWPVTASLAPEGDGSLDLNNFQVRIEFCEAPVGEEATWTRSRETSVKLDDAIEAITDTVRTNRTGPDDANGDRLWESLRVSAVTYDTVRTLDFRGFALALAGYRLVTA